MLLKGLFRLFPPTIPSSEPALLQQSFGVVKTWKFYPFWNCQYGLLLQSKDKFFLLQLSFLHLKRVAITQLRLRATTSSSPLRHIMTIGASCWYLSNATLRQSKHRLVKSRFPSTSCRPSQVETINQNNLVSGDGREVYRLWSTLRT